MPDSHEHNRVTSESYQETAEVYLELGVDAPTWLLSFMDRLVEMLPAGAEILEVGSGPGRDALHLEERGLVVRRTDATPAFVEMMCAQGHAARSLNVLTDNLHGPWSAIYANAVFLHFARPELRMVLEKCADAVKADGVLAMTVKEGDGDGWSSAKVGKPRFFTYWRAPALRDLLEATGWEIITIDHTVGRFDDWLLYLCRRRSPFT